MKAIHFQATLSCEHDNGITRDYAVKADYDTQICDISKAKGALIKNCEKLIQQIQLVSSGGEYNNE